MTRRGGSLRLRLLAATLVTLLVALAGSHLLLSSLFREHVLGQFDATLVQQLDQLAARLEPDAQGQPRIDPRTLSDPRWEKPYSGLYWQVDRLAGGGQAQVAVLRSRSLWDAQLALRDDVLVDGALHTHEHPGPRGETLRVVERALRFDEAPQVRWRLAVAADSSARRQRRTATGITLLTAGCRRGMSAKPSSTTQSMRACGKRARMSLATGRLCTTSPREEVLTRRIERMRGAWGLSFRMCA